MRIAVLQMTSSDDPSENLATLTAMLKAAKAAGAEAAFTPEVTNCVSMDRAHQASVLRSEGEDALLAGVRAEAKALGLWVSLGSLALTAEPPETRFVNRSLVVSPEGVVTARYDKMHMFDVQVSETETYRESSGYAPGSRAVVTEIAGVPVGLTVCYDVRFAYLYRALAQAGAQVLTVPAAFSPGTGPAHWEVLLRARAIETGCFVVASAQCGTHAARSGRARQTYGHSLVVAPWGEVLLDAGEKPGIHCLDLDLGRVAEARGKVPSLSHDRAFEGPIKGPEA